MMPKWAWPLAGLVGLLAVILAAQGVARAEPGFTGLQVQGIPKGTGAALGLRREEGILVRDVAVGGPAARAGFRRGDIIVGFAGAKIRKFDDIRKAVGATKPGQTIDAEVVRGGKRVKLELKTIARPASWNVKKTSFKNIEDVGFTVSALTDQVRKRFELRWGTTGIVVTFVNKSRPVAATLSRGDVIAQVNLQDIWKPDQLLRQLQRAAKSKSGKLLLLVEKRDGFQFVLLDFKKQK